MTHTETTINALVGITYSYAVELNEAAIHADHDELEQLARQITDSLKAKLRAVLEEQQAAAPTTRAALQDDGQEEALRCAAWLEHIAAGGEVVEIDGLAGTSAAELRSLSAMVDELRELLQDAKRAMTELHQSAIPDESTEGVPAIIPSEAFRKFVDAHAQLCFCLHQRGHNPQQEGK